MKYLLLLSFLMLGCSEQHQSSKQTTFDSLENGGWSIHVGSVGTNLDQGEGFGTLRRFEDKEYGVVCYKLFGRDGISCLHKDIK